MNELVGESKIGDGVGVLTSVVIIVVGPECLSETVVIVKHRCHAVKTESVKTELVKPILAIAEKEMQHLVLAVVKAQGVPSGMLAASVTVEILVIAAVESAQTLDLVLDSVGMDLSLIQLSEPTRLRRISLSVLSL